MKKMKKIVLHVIEVSNVLKEVKLTYYPCALISPAYLY